MRSRKRQKTQPLVNSPNDKRPRKQGSDRSSVLTGQKCLCNKEPLGSSKQFPRPCILVNHGSEQTTPSQDQVSGCCVLGRAFTPCSGSPVYFVQEGKEITTRDLSVSEKAAFEMGTETEEGLAVGFLGTGRDKIIAKFKTLQPSLIVADKDLPHFGYPKVRGRCVTTSNELLYHVRLTEHEPWGWMSSEQVFQQLKASGLKALECFDRYQAQECVFVCVCVCVLCVCVCVVCVCVYVVCVCVCFVCV